MSVLANRKDFERGGMYDPPYAEHPFHAERAAAIARLAPPAAVVAVWGCAYGYTVKHLLRSGVQAYGFDASRWAIKRAAERNAKYAVRRLAVADALKRHQVDRVTAPAGIFDLVVTEDMLPCMSDAEISTALANLRPTAVECIHIVTPHDSGGEPAEDDRLNWKSLAEWAELVAPDRLMDDHGNLIT